MSPYAKSLKKKKKKSERTKASRVARIDNEQVVHNIDFNDEPYSEYKSFEETMSSLYGPTGIGKTTFAFNIPGCHILATEPINNPSSFRHTRIQNWPTFKYFIDKMEKNPRLYRGVTMWAIDTIEALKDKCMSTICYEWGITDLSEEGFSRAWQELRSELEFQLLRLYDLGPGILFISHERQRESKGRRLVIHRDTMDLSNSINNCVSYLSAIIMHMRYVDKSKQSKELGHMRCLSVRGSEEEDAKDNTGRLESICYLDTGTIKFKTERIAVNKILKAFRKDL